MRESRIKDFAAAAADPGGLPGHGGIIMVQVAGMDISQPNFLYFTAKSGQILYLRKWYYTV